MAQIDRTTKGLLTLLVVGVWVLLLRPFFSASPVQAQAPKAKPESSATALAINNDHVYLYKDGKLHIFSFEVARKRQKNLAEKGFVSPSVLEPKGKPILEETYNLSLALNAKPSK